MQYNVTVAKLPVISGVKTVKAFAKLGYKVDHQTGSHIILRRDVYPYRRLTIPRHKTISKGTLRALIRQAGISVQEFVELL